MTALTSRKRAQAYSSALFLIGLAILILTDAWWPGIMLVLGLTIGLRQYLLGRFYDVMITLLVFIGAFVTVQFDISWRIFLPILFTLGAIYIITREYIESRAESEEEMEEDTNREIEERKK
jgi:predicted membrane protein